MTFFIKTYGCQMNVNDSEKIRHLLNKRGLEAAPDENSADLIVINTCAVRQKSQEKVHSHIGRLPRGKIVIVAGCVAQAERDELLRRHPAVAGTIGTHQFHRIGEILDSISGRGSRQALLAFSRDWTDLVPGSEARENGVSGYLSIMEGCNQFCAYCIVPFTRGREKYRPFRSIIGEAKRLSEQGFKEIILLGQNVNAWRDREEGKSFAGLLEHLARNTEVRWIRYITSYPGFHDPDLARVMAENPRLARHIHFPAQSGSTRILKKMSRTYTRSFYLRTVGDFRRQVPGIKFSSDFIVGFPGETERDFGLTLSLMERIEYESVFSFLYSPRRNTPAARLTDDLDAGLKRDRLHRLQDLQAGIQLRNNRKLIGENVEVLITQRNPKKSGEVIGRTESYRVVNFESDGKPGSLVRVRITKAGPHSLGGEPIK
jgi:tRNA-2-methylthio-N6-dimethylallyladenosine synthase